jgi:uncharacterized protein involved in response to NO
MMTRTARGHTARPLRADRFDVMLLRARTRGRLRSRRVPLLAPSESLLAIGPVGRPLVGRFRPLRTALLARLDSARLDGKPG